MFLSGQGQNYKAAETPTGKETKISELKGQTLISEVGPQAEVFTIDFNKSECSVTHYQYFITIIKSAVTFISTPKVLTLLKGLILIMKAESDFWRKITSYN